MKPQILSGSAVFVFPGCGCGVAAPVFSCCCVAPRVFRGPRGAGLRHGRRLASLMVLLVAPRVFRAPEGPAAREARRPHFVRRRASKPARALRSLRRPPHLWGWAAPWAAARPLAVRAASLRLGASDRSSARPRHRPRAPQPGPPLPVGVMGVSRVEFLGCFGACCDKRRQSKVYFVWISALLLQTSSIRGLFR